MKIFHLNLLNREKLNAQCTPKLAKQLALSTHFESLNKWATSEQYASIENENSLYSSDPFQVTCIPFLFTRADEKKSKTISRSKKCVWRLPNFGSHTRFHWQSNKKKKRLFVVRMYSLGPGSVNKWPLLLSHRLPLSLSNLYSMRKQLNGKQWVEAFIYCVWLQWHSPLVRYVVWLMILGVTFNSWHNQKVKYSVQTESCTVNFWRFLMGLPLLPPPTPPPQSPFFITGMGMPMQMPLQMPMPMPGFPFAGK